MTDVSGKEELKGEAPRRWGVRDIMKDVSPAPSSARDLPVPLSLSLPVSLCFSLFLSLFVPVSLSTTGSPAPLPLTPCPSLGAGTIPSPALKPCKLLLPSLPPKHTPVLGLLDCSGISLSVLTLPPLS